MADLPQLFGINQARLGIPDDAGHQPRPERNLTPLPGQNLGANTGPGKLPFPTREETILPGEEGPVVEAHLSRDGDAYTWTTQVDDTPVTWTYRPDSGTLSDLTVQAEGEEPLRPLEGGGVCLTDPATGAARELEDAELLEVRAEGGGTQASLSLVAEITGEANLTGKEVGRADGAYVHFAQNIADVINAAGEPAGSRIFRPVARELRAKNFMKIVSLAPEVL